MPVEIERIIPARAGFTRHHDAGGARQADHPRSRGVYGRAGAAGPHRPGSSPLARGLPHGPPRFGGAEGIIPARAGFTPRSPAPDGAGTDHPRSRGVYWAATTWAPRRLGSSPLARGLLGVDHGNSGACGDHPRSRGVYRAREAQERARAGIIPARAGFTASRARAGSRLQDHPRSRGVYHDPVGALLGGGGSSPLARGLLATSIVRPAKAWIIPARAGFTLWGRVAAVDLPDHPRSRGVYRTLLASSVRRQGSSPLARGLQRLDAQRVGREGIIPARAGFTGRRRSLSSAVRDHPRSRGVYTAASSRAAPAPGSSPLARGLRGAPDPGPAR